MNVDGPRFGGIISVPFHGQPHGALNAYNIFMMEKYVEAQHPGVNVEVLKTSYIDKQGKMVTISSQMATPLASQREPLNDELRFKISDAEGSFAHASEADQTAIDYLHQVGVRNMSIMYSSAKIPAAAAARPVRPSRTSHAPILTRHKTLDGNSTWQVQNPTSQGPNAHRRNPHHLQSDATPAPSNAKTLTEA